MLGRLDRQYLRRLSAAIQEAREGVAIGGHFNSRDDVEEISKMVRGQKEVMIGELMRNDQALRESLV